jgi:hypothetical protein
MTEQEYRRSEGNTMAKECPSSMEEGKVTGTISVHETIMSAGCCKTKQPHIYQSNTNNYDDFEK